MGFTEPQNVIEYKRLLQLITRFQQMSFRKNYEQIIFHFDSFLKIFSILQKSCLLIEVSFNILTLYNILYLCRSILIIILCRSILIIYL